MEAHTRNFLRRLTQRKKPSNGASVSVSETLLQDMARLVLSLSNTLQKVFQLPFQGSCHPIRAEIPLYRGYNDPASATPFLEALSDYAQGPRLSEQVLQRVLPISLVRSTARWFNLVG